MKKGLVVLVAALMMSFVATAQKIGHFNQMEVVQLMPEYKAAEAKLKEHGEALSKSIEDMKKELDAKMKKYETEAPKMTQTMKEVTEKDLNEQYARYQEKLQKADYELSQKQEELLKPILEKLRKAVDAVGSKNGYDYILESSQIHYGKPSNDITNLLKAELGIK